MTPFKRGEVWFMDLGPGLGRRPCVIVSNNARNKGLDTALALPVTTTNKHSHLPTVVAIPAGECVTGWIKCDNIIEVWPDEISAADPEGALPQTVMRRIEEGLAAALGF